MDHDTARHVAGRQYVYQRFRTPCVWPLDGVAAENHRIGSNEVHRAGADFQCSDLYKGQTVISIMNTMTANH